MVVMFLCDLFRWKLRPLAGSGRLDVAEEIGTILVCLCYQDFQTFNLDMQIHFCH